MSVRTKFYRDKANGKVLGVCAGIADYTGYDVTLIRVAMLVLIVGLSVGSLIPVYFIAGMIAPEKPRDLYDTPDDQKFWQGVRTNTRRTTTEVRSKFRELDRRLADEIEALR